MRCTKLLILGLAGFLVTPSFAADIDVIPTGTSIDMIVIRGELVTGDADRFLRAVANTELAAVLFESPGGNLIEGLRIGEIIYHRGFTTGVAPNSACASACALAWLAGSVRYMDPSSLIGFHAAYVEADGVTSESGVANALVGAYLTRLGLGISAVVFATSASPDEIAWLNAARARAVGIDFVLLTADGQEIEVRKSQSLKLPSGFRWIVLESNVTPNALKTNRFSDQIVLTNSGYFAAVLGPFEKDVAELRLASDPRIPSDAYLSSGNGFIFALE